MRRRHNSPPMLDTRTLPWLFPAVASSNLQKRGQPSSGGIRSMVSAAAAGSRAHASKARVGYSAMR